MNEPQSLRELVDLAMASHQTSVRQLGFKAQEHGFKMHGTTLGHIRNGTYKSVPTDETIRAIAWLAGVKDEVAFMAAGQPVPGPPFAEELPPGVDNLPAKARKAAIDMLRVLVDMNKEAAENATHMNQAGDSPAKEYDGPFEVSGMKTRAMRQAQTLVYRHGRGESFDYDAMDRVFLDDRWIEGAKSRNGDLEHPLLRAQFKKAVRQAFMLVQAMHEQFPTRPIAEVLDDLIRDIQKGGPDGNARGIDDVGQTKAPYVDPNAHQDADSAGNIPLPANYYELAADSSRNYGAEEDARARARGEETQDNHHDS